MITMRHLPAIAIILPMSLGCISGEDSARARADAAKAQIAIKQALNVDAAVMWRIESGTSGKHFDVYVKFGQTPQGSMAEIRATVERIVNSTFRDKVTRVSMSM
jgi:hypothetical protein